MTEPPARKIANKARCKEITGLSYRAQRRRREMGLEPVSFIVGGEVVYFEDELHAWVEKQYQEGARRVRKDPAQDERVNAWVARQLENAPPLSAEQRDLLRRVLRPEGGASRESA